MFVDVFPKTLPLRQPSLKMSLYLHVPQNVYFHFPLNHISTYSSPTTYLCNLLLKPVAISDVTRKSFRI